MHPDFPDRGHRGRIPRRGPDGFGHPFGPGRHGWGPGPGFGSGFGPGFGPRGRGRARRGDVRLVLLSLLAERPSNGYGLIRSIHERTEGRWRPSPGSVYPTLQQLVDEGLVVSGTDVRGGEYTLTDAGRDYVEEHADGLQAAWGGLPGGEPEADDPFWTSFMKLVKAVRQFSSDATPEQRAAAIQQMDQLRKSLYGMLAE
ncbi:PadR family transcriptional regulator [Naasia sp. SYSU D00948]|uniref:PadR family transcriptional regulator n=1 Tax=Naasia sp. SYSU D00948 TaxID=2817379 RepID=UPI001B302A71|nr:PadR family transcriptional regulator [Naasia sp. SYSU D00948]